MFMIDIPFNPDYEVSDAETEYIKAQFWDVIHGLEAYTGKKWSDERFKEVMASSGRASRAWIEATSQAKYVPSPFNGFDLLNHMAVMVTARGKEEAGDAMETLLKEYKENHEKGVSTFRAEEKIPYHVRGHCMLAVAACYLYRFKEQRHQHGNHHLC